MRTVVVTALVASAALALTACTSEPGSAASGTGPTQAAPTSEVTPGEASPGAPTPDATSPASAPITVTAENVTIPTDVTVAGERVQLGPVSYTLPTGATYEASQIGDGDDVHIITLAGGTSPAGTLVVEEGVANAKSSETLITNLLATIAKEAASSSVARVPQVAWTPFAAAFAAAGTLTPAGAGAAELDVLALTGYDAESQIAVTLSVNAPAGTIAEAPILAVARSLTIG